MMVINNDKTFQNIGDKIRWNLQAKKCILENIAGRRHRYHV